MTTICDECFEENPNTCKCVIAKIVRENLEGLKGEIDSLSAKIAALELEAEGNKGLDFKEVIETFMNSEFYERKGDEASSKIAPLMSTLISLLSQRGYSIEWVDPDSKDQIKIVNQ